MGGARPDRALGVYVTPNFFSTLGVEPIVGRNFRAGEHPGSVIVSFDVWQRRFKGDPSVIGQPISLDGELLTLVGVLPSSFWYSNKQIELWRPLHFQSEDLARSSRRPLTVVGRLRAGATVATAQLQVNVWADRRKKEIGVSDGVLLEGLADTVNSGLESTIGALGWAVALLLLVASANVTGLLLSRNLSREREFAIRVALGASTSSLLGQVLTETALLGVFGCTVGLALAWAGNSELLAMVPDNYRYAIAGVDRMGMNVELVIWTSFITAALVLAISVLPARRAARADVEQALRATGRGVSRRSIGMEWVVVFQIAFSLVLLIATSGGCQPFCVNKFSASCF